MSEPTSPRNAAKPKAVKKTAARALSKDAAWLPGDVADAPAALVGLGRDATWTTNTSIEAITKTSAVYEQQLQASLEAIRERLSDPGLNQDERLRLEAREDKMQEDLARSSRETRSEIRDARQDQLAITALAVIVIGGGAYAIGGKDAVKGLAALAAKVAPRAITS